MGSMRGVVALVMVWTGALAVAAPTDAAEVKSLIQRFSIEPTQSTLIVPRTVTPPTGGPPVAGEEVVNEPYGAPFTQAGGHPWALTTKIDLTTEIVLTQFGTEVAVPIHDPKDIVGSLPPGLLGDPMATPRCSLAHVASSAEQCPADTQIGVYVIRYSGSHTNLAPIVNVTPEKGQSAEFVLENHTKILTPVLTAHLVHTRAGYGFTVASNEIPLISLAHAELTFWGVPADPSHDPMRGLFCGSIEPWEPLTCEGGGELAGAALAPFVTMPADCAAGPEAATLRVDSWQEPGSVHEGVYTGYSEKTAPMDGATGCDALSFEPAIETRPDTLLADEPVELGVNVRVPLNEKPESPATPQVRDTTVTLPEGMSVSPGVVDGIQACNEFGPEGINITGPESEQVGLSGELQLAPGHCPDASTVGTAEAITPFLPIPIKGHVYLARPACGNAELGQPPCTEQDALDGRLYRLYLELGGEGELAQTGIHFKVALETQANPATGQLTTRALGTPQAPFSELRIHLNGGPRAPIDNPAACGPAVTTADFAPWSAPGITPEGLSMPGTPDATSSSFFGVSGCQSPTPFKPGFVAGTVTPNAGQFSSFMLNLSRQDREQYVKGVQVHTPPGLLAMLASVPLCPEAQANDPSVYGECTSSKIGTTRVASGAGSHPFEIEGNVYLTGPHDGAPFGLSIVTHAKAGPFDLGLVVVRARIDIDPNDSTATITADETGPYALPQILFGVPLRLQRVTVDVTRPGFMLNPTNCGAQQITAKISGNQDAVWQVSSPFAVGACKSLAFKPKFTVSTSAHTSRAKGASLDVKLSYPKDALGNDANVASVEVDLPRLLPSRLTTLQQACTAATFEANPAACPQASIVGIARAYTPLLPAIPASPSAACAVARRPCAPVSVTGPVYFVSHGGEQFPSLIVVLQGDGVRVDLTGATFISKAGITSSTFKMIPDVPVGTFELYLPQGKYSALAANGNLCKQARKLKMPTKFVAQNGLVFDQATSIRVTGCKRSKNKASPRSTRRVKGVRK
jgi:hypothetical protein